VDLVVLMGSAVLESVEVVAAAYHRGLAPRILVSGGIGHSTQYLIDAINRRDLQVDTAGRPESHIFRDLLQVNFGVDPAAIAVEDQSTNCGENAEFSRPFAGQAQSILLIQDPTMQRRTHATFERVFRDRATIELISFAPVLPWIPTNNVHASADPARVGADDIGAGPESPMIWPRNRFISLLLGEIRRLHDTADGYGPQGRNYIDHLDIPTPVLTAYLHLTAEHPTLIRPVVD